MTGFTFEKRLRENPSESLTQMADAPKLQSKIDRLIRSTQNLVNAKNPAQREAASRFLVQRANELSEERDELAAWLHEADQWASKNMPEIDADQQHENNVMWIRKLREYQAICDALQNAWDALMASYGEAA